MKVPRAPAPAPSPQGLQGPSVPCLRRRLTQLQVLTRQPRLVRQGLTHSPRALTPRCSLAPGRQPGVPGGGVGDRPGAGLSPRRGEATRERPQGNEGNRGAVLGTRGLRGRHTQTPRPSWHTRPSSPARPSADSRSELLGTFRQVRICPGALVRNPMVWELLPPALRELSSSLLDDKWSNSLQPNKPGRWAAAAFRLLGRRPVVPGSHLFPSARGQLASERCFCVSWTVSAGLQFSFQAPPSWEHRLG